MAVFTCAFEVSTFFPNNVMAHTIEISNSDAVPTNVSFNKREVFKLCRGNKWDHVLQCVRANPQIGVTPLIMDNNISTTILHQAISSKSNTQARAAVIMAILEQTPNAASIRNGYGSLPIHVICQRNTKMDSQTKERLITALMNACPKSLLEAGGVGGRTPLHIVFTDYVSPQLIRTMINMGPQAAFTRDKKGWLPIHMACSRHCSPEKLRMLLAANPSSLHAKTPEGESLLCLAKNKATKSHPNYALINELKAQLEAWNGDEAENESHMRLAEAASLVGNDRSPPSASSIVTPEQFASRVAVQQEQPAPPAVQPHAAVTLDESNGADLLLHFHHEAGNLKDDQQPEVSQFAEV